MGRQEWMAADFAQERKWRLKSARVVAGSLVSYHSKQATRAVRQQKVRRDGSLGRNESSVRWLYVLIARR